MKIKSCLLYAVMFLSFSKIAFADDFGSCIDKIKNEDYVGAKPYCEKACSLNDGWGCTRLGWFYFGGLGVKQDYKQAKTYFEKACSLNYGSGCGSLGVIYDYGFGVKQNKKVSKEYYGKACDLGLQKGCDDYRKLNEQGY